MRELGEAFGDVAELLERPPARVAAEQMLLKLGGALLGQLAVQVGGEVFAESVTLGSGHVGAPVRRAWRAALGGRGGGGFLRSRAGPR